MSSCREFRRDLESMLAGQPNPEQLVPLSWDEHLLSCESCRELLAAEHALEMLLASLPAVELPSDLAQRLLDRLRRDRAGAPGQSVDLDSLLEGAPAPEAPAGLASSVVRGLESERRKQREEARLDELLERVPASIAPPDLAVGILNCLRTEQVHPRFQLLRGARLWVSLAAAVVLAGLWISRTWLTPDKSPSGQPSNEVLVALDPTPSTEASDELNDEMVAAFDVLDNWELLTGEDLDLLLASIDELDEALFEASEWDSESEPDGSSGG